MKLNIRYLGMVIAEFELTDTSKEYVIGRADNCDIRLTKDFISRKHGRVYFENERWFYQDLRSDHPRYMPNPQPINHLTPVFIEQDTDLTTNQYLNNSETQIINLKDLKQKKSRPYSWVASFILVAAAGAFIWQNLYAPLSSQNLLGHVEERFVEFEMLKDKSLEEEFVAKGLLKPEDFKEQVGFCSGFIIAPQVVMTASHCLLGADAVSPMANFQLKTHDGVKHKIDRVLGLDISRDIIIVEVKTMKGYPHFEFKDSHEIGEPVYTVGNVHGEGMAVRDGTISSVTKDPNNPDIEYLRYTAATSPGNSGGPLVDARGQVVGLVFARSNAAENYNLSSPYFALKEFVKKFPKNQKTTVEFNTDKVIFGAYLGAQYQNYGLLNSAINSNNDFRTQENMDKLNKVTFNLELPLDFNTFRSEVQSKTHGEMKRILSEIITELKSKDKLGATWLSHVNKKHPVLVPRNLDDSLLTLDQITPDYIAEKNILIIEPGSYFERTADDHSYFINHMDNVFKKDITLKQREVFPQYLRTDIGRYGSIFNMESSLVVLDYTADEPQGLDEQKYKEAFKFEEGFIFSPYSVTYPFIRPKKLKEFKLSNFDFEKLPAMQDKYGRTWRRHKTVLFRDLHLTRYCTDYPQAQLCINKPYQVSEVDSLDIREQNYMDYHLSEKILDLNFWSTEALEQYLPANPSYEFQDAKISEGQLEYSYFGLKYSIKKAKQIKLLPAVVKTGENKSQWLTIGHQSFLPSKGESPAMICRSEIDFPKLKTSYLASYYHKHKKNKLTGLSSTEGREIAAAQKINLIQVKDFKTPKWDEPLKVYQACREILKNDYSEGYFLGEFKTPPEGAF